MLLKCYALTARNTKNNKKRKTEREKKKAGHATATKEQE